MSEEKEPHTGYSRYQASTENVQVAVKEDGKLTCIYLMTWKRWLIVVITSSIITLVLGFIFGYLTRRGVHSQPECPSTTTQPSVATSSPLVYTDETYGKLASLIDTTSIINYIDDYKTEANSVKHAGSSVTNYSLHEMNTHCKKSGLPFSRVSKSKVLLSRPAGINSATYSVTTNGVKVFNDSVPDAAANTLKPFVAYTSSGTASGPPVYVNYGRKEDFASTNYTGAICYMRYGMANPYNMITNANSHGCVGVVLYPDPEDFKSIKDSDRIIANGKRIFGDPLTPGFGSVSDNSYRISQDEATGDYMSPNIPVITASQAMVKPALQSLVTTDSTQIPKTGSLLPGFLSRSPSPDTTVEISVNNILQQGSTSRTVCAHRGGVDTDRYIFVGTHEDEAGSGNVDPASGQAILDELISLLGNNREIYLGRRSVVFVSMDTANLNVGSHEFVEEQRTEYAERLIGFIYVSGVLKSGSRLHVRSTAPLKNFMKNVAQQFQSPDLDIRHGGIEGSRFYRTYFSSVGAPVIEMSFSEETNVSAVESLPVCCDQLTADTDESKVKQAVGIYLKAIMELAGQPLIPYNVSEIKELYSDGVKMVAKYKSVMDGVPFFGPLFGDMNKRFKIMSNMLNTLDKKITMILKGKYDDIIIRRLNDAITGLTRTCILPEGVPMIDPRDSSKVIRNLNNRNMLYGSTSVNDNEMIAFPGLYELLTLSADPKSPEIANEIAKHMTEIIMSMIDVGDYTVRAISDPGVRFQ